MPGTTLVRITPSRWYICASPCARSCGCGLRRDRRRVRRVRWLAYMRARPKSLVTPPPPWAWIASSMMRRAMLGAADLDHRDLQAGGLVAGLVHHVRRLEAEQAVHLDVRAGGGDALLPHRLLGDVLAEGFAAHQPLAHLLQRHLGRADGAHAVVDAPGPSRAWLISKPRPSPRTRLPPPARGRSPAAPRRGRAGRRHSRTPAACAAPSRRARRAGHSTCDCCWWGAALGLVLPMTMATLQRGSPTPDDHHLRPLIT